MTVAYQARNPVYNSLGNIDCDYLHPDLGWIPYTAVEGGSDPMGEIIYTAAMVGQYGVVKTAPGPTPKQKLADIAARRYRAEVGGITFNSLKIDTGRDSQGLITGATLASVLDPTYVCNWKTPFGFVQLNAASLAAVSQAVRAHVQACFDREAELVTKVGNNTYTAEMLDTGWPV